ncbi:PH domain-containing protein [Candidatus Synechococcus calcipolaris G9]|uniref:PH domain-containing protein n=1 Tax=Candidatus Synechococcus calcipolaris G9 TaxID=1497997 RepID=A0ABT6EY42_9SYNE|nr:PH domain-containing protein [Candidatus Synechococcus calcipolaris]MDG2990721.1 PH domain-containing protein [Candidatus Synechococcus calcipolaris G9]
MDEILYEDTYISCDRQGLTIRWYYFPFGDKSVPYSSIQSYEKLELGFEGKWRLWGMGLIPHWFHLDPNRPKKEEGIFIDDGHPIKMIITPDDIEAVLALLETYGPKPSGPDSSSESPL